MSVVIVRYNAGNVCSVANALERLGERYLISDKPDEILSADRVIFPGVGEAGSAMAHLREQGLDAVLREVKAPFLAICLGLQLLAESSEENNAACLGIIPGRVERFTLPRKVPHMGWSGIETTREHPVFADISSGSYFYFVHSYRLPVVPETIASCTYEETFSAAVASANRIGVQFHPEKSAANGEKLLKNFLQWSV
jgi:glutamine amidotransferase